MLSALTADLRYAIRSLWHNRAIATLAILCLALGVGLTATMFSVVDGVLIQALPFREPETLGRLFATHPQSRATRWNVSYQDFRDIQEGVSGLATTGVVQNRSLTLTDGAGDAERYYGAAISWQVFDMLGVHPILGRPFHTSDDVPGAEPVALLSHAVWTRRYAQDPGIVNSRIVLNGRPYTIIGVMPERFEFPAVHKIWIPAAPVLHDAPRGVRNTALYFRLAPGVSFDRAQNELSAFAARLAAAYPTTHEGWNLLIRTFPQEAVPDDERLVILLMMGGATLVLIIACTNVANLLIARATVRRREIAIRASLGAGKGRIVRQLVTESAVLGIAAAPFGLVLAHIGTALLRAGIPPDDIPFYIQWHVDWRTTLFTAGAAVGTAMLFGLMPALQATSGTLHASLKEGSRGNVGRRSWLRNALVAAEVAMSLVALVGAMLFVRSFNNLDKADIGFDPAPLMAMRYYVPESYGTAQARPRLVRDILERVEALPGVDAAYTSNFIPLDGGGAEGALSIEGLAVDPDRRPSVAFTGVTPRFVETVGMRVVAGRVPTETEGWTPTPLAIVNETMAALFPDGDALGRRFQVGGQADDTWFTVIGIVSDVQHQDVDDGDRHEPAAYVPYPYAQTLSNGLVIRVAGDPAAITPAVRGVLRETDPEIAVGFAKTMDEVRRLTFWQYSLFGSVFSSIGFLGLVLAAVGVYGVLSYTVSQRRQEIGVMVALGASGRNVLGLIVGQGLRLAALGIVIGLFGAALAGRATASLLVGVSPFDPISFAGVAGFLALVAFVASVIPARRAMRVDPIIALRAE